MNVSIDRLKPLKSILKKNRDSKSEQCTSNFTERINCNYNFMLLHLWLSLYLLNSNHSCWWAVTWLHRAIIYFSNKSFESFRKCLVHSWRQTHQLFFQKIACGWHEVSPTNGKLFQSFMNTLIANLVLNKN